ncbi:hypothetical protein AB0K05_13020 [Nonomuraea sp. NPDC049486]|uniref:hypothetical protein n=1 Tax=Nonomuraea sp. NPDC049486 TaxID=3155773 RepID=UPI003432751F
MMTTDCTVRAEFIAGLRRLAQFLADNPKIPVPTYGQTVSVHACGSDDEQRATVDAVAGLLGVPVSDGSHYIAERDFGPIAYRAVAVFEDRRQAWDALMSYDGMVTAGGEH